MRRNSIILVALLVALLTMGPPCSPPANAPPDLVLDPLKGLVQYAQGYRLFLLADAKVRVRSYDSETTVDSTTTSADGTYSLAHAVPDEYSVTSSGCGPNQGLYIKTNPFILIFSHPDFDTTVVIVGGNPPYPLDADTALNFNEGFSSARGVQRNLSSIIIKPKSY